jgi:gliding motility-associated-like protein
MTSNRSPGGLFPLGRTAVTYTAKDPSGNTTVCTFDVIVVDTDPPDISNCPGDIVIIADNTCEGKATWTAPTVKDNCSFEITSTHNSGAKFPIGETTVTYTAKDQKGNATTCSFKVMVKTESTPQVTGCPGPISADADPNGETTVTWEEPTATAQCGEVSVSRSHEPGSVFQPGTTPVTYEFTDASGNKSACTFEVTVSEPEIRFTVSQALTPDGNGANDTWILPNIERFTDNTVLVVDRWGNKVFYAAGYDNETVFWDGTTSSGAKVPTGTYFYTIEVRFQDATVQKKGFLEVIQ